MIQWGLLTGPLLTLGDNDMKIIIEISEESYKNAKDGLVPWKAPQILAAGVPLEEYTDKLIEKIAEAIYNTLR